MSASITSATIVREPTQPAPLVTPAGRVAMWWFLSSEVAVFGGLIAVYLLNRLRHPEWATEASHTAPAIGATNTMVLLTSSLAMVLAHKAASHDDRKRAVRWMTVTLFLGLLFLGFKAIEYSREISHGYVPQRSLFWSFYYLMTGLHGLHVIAGLVAIAAVAAGVRRGRHLYRVESVGLYWHFVDVVWIFLFPLLYLVQ